MSHLRHRASPTATRKGPLPRVLALSAAVLLTGASLAACGGSSDPASGERAQEQQAETKLADFARCMREHGVHAETATGPGGGHGLKIGGPGEGKSPAVMEAAQKACARYRPTPKAVSLSPAQKVEVEERLQKFARCMREHGIKVETSTSGGGIQIGIRHAASGGPNPESPGFQQAQTDCQKFLPKGPAGKGGPFAAKGQSKSDRSEAGGAAGFSLSGGGG
jgi:hypothetical protein